MEHTKGPWVFGGIHSREIYDTQRYRAICKLSTGTLYAPEADTEMQANARLISAAPDLLEACQSVWEHINSPIDHIPGSVIEKVQQAILKATGKE